MGQERPGLNVPLLSYAAVADKAESVLRENGCWGELPVNVEWILEHGLGVDIVPVPGIQQTIEAVSFTSSDLGTIMVDEFVYNHRETRYRFSLAHELGHIVLHRGIFEKHTFASIDDWKEFHRRVDDREYSWLEAQANNFGGLLLVPRAHLKREFAAQVPTVAASIAEAREKGFGREQYLDLAVEEIVDRLRPVFNVSDTVLRIRVEKDGLAEEIS